MFAAVTLRARPPGPPWPERNITFRSSGGGGAGRQAQGLRRAWTAGVAVPPRSGRGSWARRGPPGIESGYLVLARLW